MRLSDSDVHSFFMWLVNWIRVGEGRSVILHPEEVAHDAVGDKDALSCQVQAVAVDGEGPLLQVRTGIVQAEVMKLLAKLCLQGGEEESSGGADGCDDAVVVAGVQVECLHFARQFAGLDVFDVPIE